jgi:hypothetical protein
MACIERMLVFEIKIWVGTAYREDGSIYIIWVGTAYREDGSIWN